MWKEKIRSILSGQKARRTEKRENSGNKELAIEKETQDRNEKVFFKKAHFQESSGMVRNPGCGWYHLYTFDAAKIDEPLYIVCEKEELVLLRIGLGAFRDKPISEQSLEWIRKILAFFQKKEKGMILRFAYDLEGKGLEREPGSIRLVQKHMQQLGSIIREYADDIFVIQGILIGNWGEMHGSRYLTPEGIRTLTDTMVKAVDGVCPVAVRKPAQWRELTRGWTEEEKKKLTLFNDGMFGSETDLGTYGTLSPETPGQKIRSREEELEWQKNEMRGRFCGGEVVWNSEAVRKSEAVQDSKTAKSSEMGHAPGVSAEKAIADFERMHVSYLNSTYDLRLLERWKAERIGDTGEENGLEAIGKRLGYRFVVENVEIVPEIKEENSKAQLVKDVSQTDSGKNSREYTITFKITLENKGFAELTEGADCYLELEKDGELQERIMMETDARTWISGEKADFCQRIKLPAEAIDNPEEKRRDLYLALYRRRDGRRISFANHKEKQGRAFLGILNFN